MSRAPPAGQRRGAGLSPRPHARPPLQDSFLLSRAGRADGTPRRRKAAPAATARSTTTGAAARTSVRRGIGHQPLYRGGGPRRNASGRAETQAPSWLAGPFVSHRRMMRPGPLGRPAWAFSCRREASCRQARRAASPARGKARRSPAASPHRRWRTVAGRGQGRPGFLAPPSGAASERIRPRVRFRRRSAQRSRPRSTRHRPPAAKNAAQARSPPPAPARGRPVDAVTGVRRPRRRSASGREDVGACGDGEHCAVRGPVTDGVLSRR